MALRPNVLQNNTTIKEGNKFSAAEVQNTYNNFSRLNAVRFTNIHFDENEEDGLLDCGIKVSTRKPNTISFQPEGTNTEGDFGAAATLTYSNNNIFRGSELFSVQFRGAYEAIKGLDGYQNQNYIEYNVETRLAFPRIIAPFLSQNVRYDNSAKSELMFSYNMQNRPSFIVAYLHRHGVTTGRDCMACLTVSTLLTSTLYTCLGFHPHSRAIILTTPIIATQSSSTTMRICLL